MNRELINRYDWTYCAAVVATHWAYHWGCKPSEPAPQVHDPLPVYSA